MALVLVLVFMNLLSLVTSAPAKPSSNNGPKLDILKTLQEANSATGDLLIEGDIVKYRNSGAQIPGQNTGVQNNADQCTSINCLWPKVGDIVPVPVSIDRSFDRRAKTTIQSALGSIEAVTCIRFVSVQKNVPDQIRIFPGSGCWSYVGRIGGTQDLSLQANGCVYSQIIQHEILHALGFHHEHTRSDRDDNITIQFQNIISGYEFNFDKRQTNNLQTPYDFTSVMQYSNYAFSSNGQMTIVANHDSAYRFGGATFMSSNDILRINRLYGCTAYLPTTP